MFYDFSHRHSPCTVEGESDIVILSRETRATTIIGKEYLYNGVFAPTSPVKVGDLVETDESFLVQTMRSTTEKDKYCSLIKTNVLIDIQRYAQRYDSNDNPIGAPSFNPVQINVKGYAQYVTARLRQDEAGLLPTTVYILQLQTTAGVKDPQDESLVSPDRIVMGGKPYQVDAVDRVKYPNLYHLQLSEDVR
ncbi:hypothetical protein P4H66_19460 [Paenibacillus dokdonensis]|uniref:Head-tail joining protein n=1 Tax=Paenibacillus dokdonensis TaxID=2567944 RepID=A0ABU6GQE8_9BACL|nr:hypothetical protein [Paenibacillus dokdonensis]MEC0241984.1 hypothetical protein [Paenibacillus dokdonensis]